MKKYYAQHLCRTWMPDGVQTKETEKTSLPNSEKDEEEAQENDDSETEKLSIFIFPSHENYIFKAITFLKTKI